MFIPTGNKFIRFGNKPRDKYSLSHNIILMDIKMPEMNGFEANRLIRMINNQISVIAVTAFAQTADRIKIMNEKFDDYISKPINANKLLDIISTHALKNYY